MSAAAKRKKKPSRKSKSEHPSGDDRYVAIDRAAKLNGGGPDALLEVLSVAQQTFGYISEERLIYVSNLLGVPMSQVYGVATFYHLFTFEPKGDHNCIICIGTACHVKGADKMVKHMSETYSVAVGGTTEDKVFSLTTARCLGSCGLAPMAVLDGNVLGKQTAESLADHVDEAIEAEEVAA